MASTLGQFVPTPRVPQAYTSGPVTALRIANGSAYVLRVILGGVLYDKVPAGADQTYTLANLAGYGGWVLLIPGEAPVNQNRLAGPVIVTSYGGGDTIPYGSVTQQSEALYSPNLAQPDWILDTLRGGLVFNVKMFGAQGDGVTDDTAAINACLNAAGVAGGGKVYLPAGTASYFVSGTLIVPGNVTLAGDGAPTIGTSAVSTIFTSSATADVVKLNAGGAAVRDLHITATAGARSAGAGINIATTNFYYTVANVNLDNMYDGIVIGSAGQAPNTIMMTNINSHNCSHTHLTFAGGGNLYLTNVAVWQDNAGTNQSGFLWTGGAGLYATQCTAFKCGTGFSMIPAGTNSLEFAWFVNCSADTCDTRGWNISGGGAGAAIAQVYLTNCWGSSSGTNDGLSINSGGGTTLDITLSGFQAFNNGTNGIVVNAGTGVDIIGARCAGNSRTVHNTNYGIYVGPGVSSFSIAHCRSGAFDGYGATQKEGILVDVGASNNYSITGNDVSGNATQGLADFGTGTTKVIADNIGYNPIGSVTIAAPASGSPSAANSWGVPVQVFLSSSGGSVSAVTVAGVALGAVTQFTLAPGQTFTPTYTGALSVKALAG